MLAPKLAGSKALFERAKERGEIRADVDIELLAPALAGIVLHRFFLVGEAAHRGPRHQRHRPDHPAGRHRGRLTDIPPTQREITMTDTRPDVAVEEVAETKGNRRLLWALVLISVAQLMVVLDGTIVNIALPYIQSDLDISIANLRWVVTGYALAFGSLLLLGGRLGDLYGRRKVFMTGLVIFGVASLLGGLATSEGLLLAARGLQGLGAALASPAALALIATTFPAGPARNRAFAVYAAMSGVGAAVGLLLGGWLTGTDLSLFGTDIDGWRLTLLINTPIGIATAFLAPRFLAESESHPGELDLPGAAAGTARPARPRLRHQPRRHRTAGPTRGRSPAWPPASCCSALFVLIESRVAHPLLPVRVFTNRTRAASFVAMFFAPAAMFAMFFYLSQYIQVVMGYSPLRGRRRVPAVLRRPGARGRDLLEPGQPHRPAVPRRCRHADGRGRAVRVLPAALRHHGPGERRPGQLRRPTCCRSS